MLKCEFHKIGFVWLTRKTNVRERERERERERWIFNWLDNF